MKLDPTQWLRHTPLSQSLSRVEPNPRRKSELCESTARLAAETPLRNMTVLSDNSPITSFLSFDQLVAGMPKSGQATRNESSSICGSFLRGVLPPPNLKAPRPLVFFGHERRTRVQCVIKVLHKATLPESTGGEVLWKQMCRQVLNLTHHPNFLAVFGIYEDECRYYIVSEKLLGGEFYHFLANETRVPEELCKHLVRQILLSLDFLHSNGLVHRDVKPENLMFRNAIRSTSPSSTCFSEAAENAVAGSERRSGKEAENTEMMHSIGEYLMPFELVLIDFDTVRMTGVQSSLYGDWFKGRRRLVGTYNYMAPELLSGGEYSPASDLWAVGVIVYTLMTGVPPMGMEAMRSASSTLATLRTVERDGIDFDFYPLQYFSHARDLCQRLLQFEPRRRLNSAADALKHPWLVTNSHFSARYYLNPAIRPQQPSCGCRRPHAWDLPAQPKPLPLHSNLTNPSLASRHGVATPANKTRRSLPHDFDTTATCSDDDVL